MARRERRVRRDSVRSNRYADWETKDELVASLIAMNKEVFEQTSDLAELRETVDRRGRAIVACERAVERGRASESELRARVAGFKDAQRQLRGPVAYLRDVYEDNVELEEAGQLIGLGPASLRYWDEAQDLLETLMGEYESYQ